MGNANLGAQSSSAPLPGGAIANTSISSAELDASAVTTDKLAANAVTAAKIASGTITIAELAQSLKNYLVPIGTVFPYAGSVSSPPSGYLACDGSTHNTTGTCATCGLVHTDLAAVLGITYGGTSGSTFKLPDLQGRVPVGKGTHVDVNALNNNEGVATVSSRTPNHTHSVPPHKHYISALSLSSHDHSHGGATASGSQSYGAVGVQVGGYGPAFFADANGVSGGQISTYYLPIPALGIYNDNHTHTLTNGSNDTYNRAGNSANVSGDATFSTSAQSSAQRVPYIVLNYIIKAI